MSILKASYADKKNNLNKLEEIASLKEDWDHKGAKAFSREQIMKVRDLIIFLSVQPEIIPTACGTIQLEYEKENGAYLEFEIKEDDIIRIYEEHPEGKNSGEIVDADIGTINRIVQDFYKSEDFVCVKCK